MNSIATKSDASSDIQNNSESKQPINYRLEMYKAIIADAQGQPIDKNMRRDAMLELGWDNAQYHRAIAKARTRLQADAEIKELKERLAQFFHATAERERLRHQCNAAIKRRTEELQAQLQAETNKLREPLTTFESQNHEALNAGSGGQDERELRSVLERTAHPHIFNEIASLNNQLLTLDNEAGNFMEAIRRNYGTVQDIEYSKYDLPLRLRGTQTIDREYWVDAAAMAKAVLDDEDSAPRDRIQAQREYYDAAGRVEQIDSNQKRFDEISGEKSAIEGKIKQLTERLYQWDYFSID